MNVFNRYCLTLIFIFSVGAKASVLEYPETEDDMARAMLALDYEDVPKNYSFQNANQSYDLPEGWAIFHKENARKLLFYINGADTFSKVNAVAIDYDFDYQLIFSYVDSGYIDASDWDRLDPDLLMEGIIESTFEANKTRVSNGVPKIEVKGWITEPTYDPTRDIAFYVIEAESAGESILNSVALKLGREGFTNITYVTGAGSPQEAADTLLAKLDGHSFDAGFLYADYEQGNKMAGFGLASLVALTAGSKNGKGVAAGLMATLLIFAKKLWFVIFLPFVFLWGKIKQKFGSK